ncbi:hypothetical protein THIOSC13_220041 [uncultured Thiomicrorhabdus sp.]|jgi:hypothetical protein|nr:hypothetical protein [Thiomicrorhabdus marina]
MEEKNKQIEILEQQELQNWASILVEEWDSTKELQFLDIDSAE